MKTCSRCQGTKPPEAFSRCSARADGLQNYCKDCASDKGKLRPARPPSSDEHRERKRAYAREYHKNNREKRNAWARAAYIRNPEKERARRQAYVDRDPERVAKRLRNWHLTRKYGLTLERWATMFEQQGSKCAVCEATEPGGKWWHTDHCHKTGLVRGILCHNCNLALGHMNDSKDMVLRFYSYLAAAEQASP